MRLQYDVQLAEDYYLSKWRRGKSTEGKKERKRERKTTKSEETERRGREGNVTSSIMVQLLLCITYSR